MARETVAERHTWERHLDKLEELFDELVDSRRVAWNAGEVTAIR